MERGEENWWEKLRRVGKRGGHSTPAASFWRTNHELGLSRTGCRDSRNYKQGATVSSRKLAAALWDLHHYKVEVPLDNMRRGGSTVPPPGLRRRHNPQPLNPPPSFHLPETSRNLRKNVSKSLMQHHRSVEKSHNRATRTVSPSSASSSMEIAPSNPAATPSGSIELRTSTELLKVLNRVWSLEEHHVSNMSLIQALKRELDRARFHAKELAREQQGGRHDMDELMKHITEGKQIAKDKEQDRIEAKVESTRDELNNERKLRKHSESLQRKLAQELYEVKSSLSSISKELKEEKMSRGLVEDLCDELAWGLRDYEKGLGERDDRNQLILRISQAWLDERMQVKQQHQGNVGENNPTFHKLSSQFEALLQNERSSEAKINPMLQKSFLESIPLNLGASARREEDDDDDDASSSSHSNCFEVEKTSQSCLKPHGLKCQENNIEEILKKEEFKQKHESSDWTRSLSPSRLQAKFEEHMAREQIIAGKGNPGETGISKMAENIAEDKHESEGINELDSKYVIDNIIRNYYSFRENGMQSHKDHVMASSLGRSFQSPVREWTEKLPAQDPDTSEFLPELKESTLRAKLSEERSRGQKSRSRQKASIYPSRE